MISSLQSKPSPILSWVIVLAFPLFSLPWVISRMCKLEKTAFVQYAFFMGLVGILFPPSGDLYRYYLDYTTYKDLDFDSFLTYALLEFDYFLSFLLYGMASLDIPCDLSRFLFSFIGFSLTSNLFIQIIKDNPSTWKNKGSFLLIFFVLSLNVYLYRSGLACILFMYGAYFVVYKESKRHWFYVLFSMFVHFSFVLYVLVLLLSRVAPLVIRKRIWYTILLTIFLFGIFNVGVLFDVGGFSGELFERYKAYMESEVMGHYAEQFSLKALIWQKFGYFIAFVLLYFFVGFRNVSKKREWSFIDYVFLLSVAASPFSVIFSRFVVPLTIILKIFLIEHFQDTIIMQKYLKALIIMVIIMDVMNLWAKRREIAVSDMSMLATSTSISILNHTYTEAWINRNINAYGDFEEYSEY